MNFRTYINKFFLLVAGIGLFGFALFKYAIPQYYLQVFPFIFVAAIIVTILFHYFVFKSAKKGTQIFIRTIMIATLVKLFAYLILATILMATDRKNALSYAVVFIVLYFVFMFFEMLQLIKVVKRTGKNNPNQ